MSPTDNPLQPIVTALRDGSNPEIVVHLLTVYMRDSKSARQIEETIGLESLFSLLNIVDPEQLQATCNVICKVVEGLPDSTLLSASNLQFVRLGLSSPVYEIKRLCISQIKRLVVTESNVIVLIYADLVSIALSHIGDEDLSLASIASSVCVSLAWTNAGLEYLCGPVITKVLDELMDPAVHDDAKRFRVYDAVVRAATISTKALEAFEKVNLLNRVKADFRTQDPLVRMSVVQLFAEMSSSPTLYKFLVSSGALSELSKAVANVSDPLNSYILPSVLRFYGGLATLQEEQFEQIFNEHGLATILVYHLNESDVSLKVTVLSTLGMIGQSKVGLKVIATQPDLVKAAVCLCVSTQTDVRTIAHHSLASLLRLQDAEVDFYQQHIYESLVFQADERGFIAYLQQLVRQPFVDTKLGVYDFMLSLAGHKWGRQVLASSAGLMESITDSRNDVTNEVTMARYEVVDQLSNTGKGELSEKILSGLNAAVQRRPARQHEARPELQTMS
eukprot:CFRG5095T1